MPVQPSRFRSSLLSRERQEPQSAASVLKSLLASIVSCGEFLYRAVRQNLISIFNVRQCTARELATRDKTYAVLTREVKMPQYLLINTQPLLMHPRRYPLILLALPIPLHLRIRHLTPLLLSFIPHILYLHSSSALASDRKRSRALQLLFRPRWVFVFRVRRGRRDIGDGLLHPRGVGGGGVGFSFFRGCGVGGFGYFVGAGAEGEGLLGAGGGA